MSDYINSLWEDMENRAGGMHPLHLAIGCLLVGNAVGICSAACCFHSRSRCHERSSKSEPAMVEEPKTTPVSTPASRIPPIKTEQPRPHAQVATPAVAEDTVLLKKTMHDVAIQALVEREQPNDAKVGLPSNRVIVSTECQNTLQLTDAGIAKSRNDFKGASVGTKRNAKLREVSVQTTATMQGVGEKGLVRFGEPVTLHIYDVTVKENMQWVNGILRNVGTGAFHAGVEVFGLEWSFGYTDTGGSGVHNCTPAGNQLHRYREKVPMGATPLTELEVEVLIEQFAKAWSGREYDVLTRNCCHFSEALCTALAVGPVPQWVLRLAGAGAQFRSGVDSAVLHAQAAANAVAARATELDEQYKISSAVDGMAERVIGELEKPIGMLDRPVDLDLEREMSSAQLMWSTAARRTRDFTEELAGKIWNSLPQSELPKSEFSRSLSARSESNARARVIEASADLERGDVRV